MFELTSYFIYSQIFVFSAMIFDFLAFQFKKRKYIFLCLIVSTCLISLHYFFLNKIAAAIILVFSAIRFVTYYFTENKNYLYIFIVLNIISLFFTYKEIYDLIICVGTIIFIIGMMQKEDKSMREIMMISMAMAIIYNLIIFSPMGVVTETSVLISNLLGYYRHHIDLSPA
jgi:hypothetical protein